MPRAKWPKVGDLVLLEWVDIQTDSGWAPEHESPGLAQCKTVGWVAHLDRKSVTLTSSLGECNGHVESNLRKCIPKGCVTSWSVVR